MKILIATAVYYPMTNGVATFSHSLAVGLVQRGHVVTVICPSQTGRKYNRTIDGVRVQYLKSASIRIYPDQIHKTNPKKNFLGIGRSFSWYKHGFRVSVFPQHEVKKILDEAQPDVVHVQVSDPIGLSVVWWARKNGVPVVTTEHNQPEVLTEPLRVPRVMRRGANFVLASYLRNRQSKSDFVTMPTEQAIRNLLSRGKEFPVPVEAVSNGVDLKRFHPGRASVDIYKKYHIPRTVPVVFHVGRLDPEKHVGMAIEAFLMARNEVPNAVMVIVGDGVDRARLEKKFRAEKEAVHFLGRVTGDDLYELYRVGTVFVTASPVETQGIVLIEAAACGLPLVAADLGAVGEVCRNGENGYLVHPGNIAEMAQAILVLLTDEKIRNDFSKASVLIAREHDFERTLDKFESIYRRVIEGGALNRE